MAPVAMVGNLFINNFQISDTTTDPHQLATQLKTGRNYELLVCVKNRNPDDTFWYDNVQLRIAPVGRSLQFFSDASYNQMIYQYNSSLFSMRSNESRWLTIPFRWTGNQPAVATSAKFDTGIYAHELPIRSAWRKLSHPI